jgi:hypothetical protein
MPLVAFTGFKQAGKDTAASFLVKDFGFKKVAFADPLRGAAEDLDPLIDLTEAPDEVRQIFSNHTTARYKRILSAIGYERAKTIPDFRRFLQLFGTDAVRKHVSDTAWIDAISRIVPIRTTRKYVLTDCRFPNEADWVHERGELWRVTRPGQDTSDAHPSEAYISSLEADLEIVNDGSVDELAEKVRFAWSGWEERAGARVHTRYRKRHGEEKLKEIEKWRHVESTYGLSPEDFMERYEAQNGRCFTCGREVPLCVDHDHKTGQVRGLLCRVCNASIDVMDQRLLLCYQNMWGIETKEQSIWDRLSMLRKYGELVNTVEL